jgi:rRNA-processing protein FCF1
MSNKAIQPTATIASVPFASGDGKPNLKPIKVILDTNIYDSLENDSATCVLVWAMVESGLLTVIVTRTIAEELWESPFGGIPNFFKTEYMGNTVARCGIMRAGDSLGSGEIYEEHLGTSRKVNDALIADAASWVADWIVSEDQRLRKRFSQQNVRCTAMSYEEFRHRLKEMKSDDR